jgi:hypothetical protein
MTISITELILLCWAILVTGFYLSERARHRQFVKMTDAVLRAVANKKANIIIKDDDNLTVEGTF